VPLALGALFAVTLGRGGISSSILHFFKISLHNIKCLRNSPRI